MEKIVAIANQKGGTGKTSLTANLGVGLVRAGRKVLVIDNDPQSDLTEMLGWNPDELPMTLTDVYTKEMTEADYKPSDIILHHHEGIDLLPCDLDLSSQEYTLVSAMNRERLLKNFINRVKKQYDHILIDCPPTLGILTINALTAANSVLIPVMPHKMPARGMVKLLANVSRVQRQLNKSLKVEGIIFTIVDERTNYAKGLMEAIQESYGGDIKIFSAVVPRAITGAEMSGTGKSIFAYDPKGKVAGAYENIVKEIQSDEKRCAVRAKSPHAR